MADFDWPDALRPASVDWGLITPQVSGRSAFDSSTQATTLGPGRWAFTITTGPIKRDMAAEWEAFVLKLRGRVNRVRCWDWRRELPLGVATGAPTVRLAASGATAEVQGWTPNVPNILKAGSYLGIYGELKMLTDTASSDAAGRTLLKFEPPLRSTAPAGTVVVLVKPKAMFRLTSERPSMAQNGAKVPGQTYTFEEDLAP